MNNDYLLVIVFALVAGIWGSALILSATKRQGVAIVGGAIVSLAFWLAIRFMHG